MKRSVVIDFLPESAPSYREEYAIVAVDVIRATTTAITAIATGRRCFPVSSIEAALSRRERLERPLLVGEVGGNMPYGFDLTNSPAQIDVDADIERPMILLSSSGTLLIHNARFCEAVYAACLRNYEGIVRHLAVQHHRVAIIGAGSRNEFRREDQLCCAWIAAGLRQAGFAPEDDRTQQLIDRWRRADPAVIASGNSARYLRDTGQLADLEFILEHINDLNWAVQLVGEELVRAAPAGEKVTGSDSSRLNIFSKMTML